MVLVRFVPFEFRKNRAPHSARTPLIHSCSYESADDRADYFAPFPLKFESFNQYPG